MKQYTIRVGDETAAFYEKVARQAGRPVEQVLPDALFRTAGERTMEVLRGKGRAM